MSYTIKQKNTANAMFIRHRLLKFLLEFHIKKHDELETKVFSCTAVKLGKPMSLLRQVIHEGVSHQNPDFHFSTGVPARPYSTRLPDEVVPIFEEFKFYKDKIEEVTEIVKEIFDRALLYAYNDETFLSFFPECYKNILMNINLFAIWEEMENLHEKTDEYCSQIHLNYLAALASSDKNMEYLKQVFLEAKLLQKQ